MKPRTFTFVHSSIADPVTSGAGALAVFRRRNATRMEVGCFLLDRSCLGVRDAWYEEVEEAGLEEIKERLFDNDCLERDGAWGRKLVEGAVDYARQFGFKPSRHYKKAARVFGGIKADDCAETFVYGEDGKPFFVAHPDDSPETMRQIIRQLEIRCGEGNFNYMVQINEDSMSDRPHSCSQHLAR